ncbi:MAG: trypsin-like peptidase domain-containing protein [Gemmataceae bacterium]
MIPLLHRGPLSGLTGVLFGLVLVTAMTPADTADQPKAKKPPTAPVTTFEPENPEDLKAIQEQVKLVLKRALPATVGVSLGSSAGSGVVINEEGYVLTAGHVSGKPDQVCTLIFPDGKRVRGKTLGWNKRLDSGLIKITEKGKWPFMPMGDSKKLKKGQWVIGVGHPGGFRPGRTPVVRLGRVLNNTATLIQTDCALVGGDSGGPLFDLDGRVVGIHSRISWNITANIHVPVSVYKEDWPRLAKGDEWGGMLDFLSRPGSAYLGVGFEPEKDDLKVVEVTKDTAAEKAGVKVGDVLAKVDDVKLEKRADLFAFMRKKKPGEQITLEVVRAGKPMKISVKLGTRPSE